MSDGSDLDGTAVVGWLLAGVGIACVVGGAYLTGTSGDVHPLLVVGLGATGTWVALESDLHGEAESASNDGEESNGGEESSDGSDSSGGRDPSDGSGSSDAEGST